MIPAEQTELEGDFIPVGTTLLNGTYTITDHLGEGGFGLTYLADDQIGRKVVIKECFPANVCRRQSGLVRPQTRSHQGDFEKLIQTFIGEARQLAKLKSRNVVPVHHFFEENGTAYMSLEYIEGEDLSSLAENDRASLTPKRVLDIARALVEALDYIHSRGVIHRDIAPDNIIVTEDGTPVLIDFGAARNEAAQTVTRLLSQQLSAVKDGYSPQEFYISGEPHTAASDIYSLAATLYTVITGEIPATANRRLVAMTRHDPDPLPPLSGRIKGYPASFLHAIDSALSVFAQDRPKTALEFANLMDKSAAPAAASSPSLVRSDAVQKPPRPAGTETALRFHSDDPRPANADPAGAPSRIRVVQSGETASKSAKPAAQADAPATKKARPRLGLVAAGLVIAIPVVGAGAYLAFNSADKPLDVLPPAELVATASAPVSPDRDAASVPVSAPVSPRVLTSATNPAALSNLVAEPASPSALTTQAATGALRGPKGWSMDFRLPLKPGQDANGGKAIVFAGGEMSPYPAGTILVEVGGTAVGSDIDAIAPTLLLYFAENDPAAPGLPVTVSNPVFGSIASSVLPVDVERRIGFGAFSVSQTASDGQWRLTVVETDRDGAFQVGDVILSEKNSGRPLARATDLRDALAGHSRLNRPMVDVLVERHGTPVLVTFPMDGFETAGL